MEHNAFDRAWTAHRQYVADIRASARAAAGRQRHAPSVVASGGNWLQRMVAAWA